MQQNTRDKKQPTREPKQNTKSCNNKTDTQNLAKRLPLSPAAPLLLPLLLATATKISFGGKTREGRGEVWHTEKIPFALFLLYKERERASPLPVLCAEPRLSLPALISWIQTCFKSIKTFGSFSFALMQPYPREKASRNGWFWFSNSTKNKIK